MKKTNLIKIFSMVVIAMMIISFATSIFAANEDDGFTDLTNTLTNSASNNTNTNTTNNTNISSSVNNTTNNTNKNSSVYNNTTLPKTGIEDSAPIALLIAVFTISAVFAYKKVNEYKNI